MRPVAASFPRAKPGERRLCNIEINNMKKEYDFSKAERGRFYRRNAKLNLPVYLEPQVQAWFGKVAAKRGEDVGKLVNRLLKREIKLADAAR